MYSLWKSFSRPRAEQALNMGSQTRVQYFQPFLATPHSPHRRTEVRAELRNVRAIVSLFNIHTPEELMQQYVAGTDRFPLTRPNMLSVLRHFHRRDVKEFIAKHRKALKKEASASSPAR
jgi:hypothetical protein